uniref:NADH dehydrogenase subunits 2 n=1 Tax=Bunostomum trigonocephalum TaxID=66065 RepID=T2AY69_9BILA|nr:NADH dehydrogenase subunits 2 [Bunostomum trigonocephalum]
MFVIFFNNISVFLSFLALLVNNILVWWSIFLIMTLVFVMLNKKIGSYSSLFNYFVIQESLGLVFLMFSFSYFQLLILLLKIGVSPFHFWIFNVTNSVFGYNLVWFLTFQKLPFLVVLLQFLIGGFMFLLILGLFVCLLQMFLTKGFKNLLILSSTESFNWIVLGFMISFFNVFFIFVYYFMVMVFLIPKFEYMNIFGYLSWETMLVFMNLPFSVNFFVKIFSLSEILKIHGFSVLMLLLLMFFSVLSLSFWLVNLSTKFFVVFKYGKSLFYFFIPLTLVVLI